MKQRNARGHVPLPAPTFPPYVERAHGRVRKVQGRTPQAPHTVHHATLAPSALCLDSHGHEALNFSTQVALACVGVSPILAPLTAKGAALGGVGGYGRAFDERKALGLVEPCSFALAGGEELVEEGRVDHSDDGLPRDDEGDGDAEHGEEVGVVDGSVQRVDTPCWISGGDEIVF